MNKVLTVSEIGEILERTFNQLFLDAYEIEGEISNITYQNTGHLYFTLKDKNAQIKCAVFRYKDKGIIRDLKDGEKIQVKGTVSFYKPGGSVTFKVTKLQRLDLLGKLHQELEKLKLKYYEMGYFDENKKKPIPRIVKRLGVITSQTGAAIQDIINTTHNRDKYVDIFLYPVKVQGEGSKEEISNALNYFNDNQEIYNLDAIIVGRGGGSIEDLWSFNEKEVVEAIYNSKIFVVSAVGHETDTLLSDYVADLRASTPTQAAEKIIKKLEDEENTLKTFEYKINKSLENKYKVLKNEILSIKNSYIIRKFDERISEKRIILSDLEDKLIQKLEYKFEKVKNNFDNIKLKININNVYTKIEMLKNMINNEKVNLIKNMNIKIEKKKNELENLRLITSKHSNEDILKKGYTITTYKGKVVKRSIDLSKGSKIETMFLDGCVESKVE
ncbi:exodeoxyribonuclease VII large subunit [Streptobacillus felis]|uniref:Exodeoxyribonuclease 7 large subunit n=1 Tax=Streptobacillus felis TaxID=1384509 RepID=A0A7Z0PEV0_9FUSO|nr:exodeoxyribonuclease VII large subunit [Streptobacillus felis]NYV27242.1 exodeoxyribonuclease VII large subunit [Streptobacillus felis]